MSVTLPNTTLRFSDINALLGNTTDTQLKMSSLYGTFSDTPINPGQSLTLAPLRGKQTSQLKNALRAAGGEVTDINGYRIHAFKQVGEHTFTVFNEGEVEVLMVAGGGGGGTGFGGDCEPGGGGAGGLIYRRSFPVSTGTVAVTVGAGGGGGPNPGASGLNGGNSVFGSLVALGGGGGGNGGSGGVGKDGGSGGGAGHAWVHGMGTASQGLSGGGGTAYTGTNVTYGNAGGGGGGAGSPGNTNHPTYGGNGLYFPQFETVAGSPAGWFAAGGQGGAWDTYPAYTSYGGGGKSNPTRGVGTPTSGVANTGGGGGGSHYCDGAVPGAAGGSGIVLVRYPLLGKGAFDGITMPAAAYSTRRLFETYRGPILRIRGSSNSVEADVFIDAQGDITGIGSPDVQDLNAYLNGAVAEVVTWYDQSGNQNHMYATTPAPILQFDGPHLVVDTSSLVGYLRPMISNTYTNGRTGNGAYTVTAVIKPNQVANNTIVFSFGPANANCDGESIHPIAIGPQSRFGGGSCGARGTWGNTNGTIPVAGRYYKLSTTFTGGTNGTEKLYVDGTLTTQATMTTNTPISTANRFGLGWIRDDGATFGANVKIQLLMLHAQLEMSDVQVSTLHNQLFATIPAAIGAVDGTQHRRALSHW
jgi:hypothetical protein